MKTKELEKLVREGARPIIRVRDSTYGVIDGPDDGMLGRVVSVGEEDIYEKGTSILVFTIDFFEFTDYNKPIATRDWYDADGNPTLIWMDVSDYEKDSKSFKIFEMYVENFEYSDLRYLELSEENETLSEYLSSNQELSYVQWLEDKVRKLS